jgi:prepilin-type N-terminal cleavage/methylation domain-containing protein
MRYEKGFTFIELILVMALILILGTMSTAFAARFLTQNAVDNTTDQFVSSFRKAQLNAIMGKQDSNWGVNYASNTITLYRGNSFATRTTAFDERYTVNTAVTVSGMTDLNFTSMTGAPGSTPTITISGNGNTNTITVNSQGVVSR